MARLLADENIHPDLVQILRSGGHEVVCVKETGLAGASDETVLSAAVREERILITADKDFGLILEIGPLSGRGRVLLLRYSLLDWPRIGADVGKVLASVERDYAADPRLLVVLSEGLYRIRHSSPIEPGP